MNEGMPEYMSDGVDRMGRMREQHEIQERQAAGLNSGMVCLYRARGEMV